MFVPWIQASCFADVSNSNLRLFMEAIGIPLLAELSMFLGFLKNTDLPGCLSESTHFFDVAENPLFWRGQPTKVVNFLIFFGKPKFLYHFACSTQKVGMLSCPETICENQGRVWGVANQPPHFSIRSTPLEVVPWWVSSFVVWWNHC